MPTPLEDRVAILEQLVTELRDELARPPRRESMSKTCTCPCCGHGVILGIRSVMEHTHGGLVPLALGNKATFWSSTPGAPLQAYICKACRYVEWHVATVANLVVDGENVLEFRRPEEPLAPHDAPYR